MWNHRWKVIMLTILAYIFETIPLYLKYIQFDNVPIIGIKIDLNWSSDWTNTGRKVKSEKYAIYIYSNWKFVHSQRNGRRKKLNHCEINLQIFQFLFLYNLHSSSPFSFSTVNREWILSRKRGKGINVNVKRNGRPRVGPQPIRGITLSIEIAALAWV